MKDPTACRRGCSSPETAVAFPPGQKQGEPTATSPSPIDPGACGPHRSPLLPALILVDSAQSSPNPSSPSPHRSRGGRRLSLFRRGAGVEMFASRPAVHPVEAPPPTDPVEQPTGVLMKDLPGMPGTAGGLALRLAQFAFAAVALAVMASTNDFPSVSAFCYLVAATILQCLWSFSLAIVDIYALLVKRCLRNRRAVCLFAIGDGITAALIFGAACSSAGITVLIDNDLNICAENHCGSFETATAMAFMSWFALTPSFLLNFWSMASR